MVTSRDPGHSGNHIDITRAEWIYKEAGIGGNVDSYYEYLLKAGLFFEDVSSDVTLQLINSILYSSYQDS